MSLVQNHLVCYSDDWGDAAVRRWIRRVSRDRVEDLYALNRADILGKGRDVTDELQRRHHVGGIAREDVCLRRWQCGVRGASGEARAQRSSSLSTAMRSP